MNNAFMELSLEALISLRTGAMDALHRLMTGDQEVAVRVADRMAQYQPVDIDKLKGYIAELDAVIFTKQTGTPAMRRPMYLRF